MLAKIEADYCIDRSRVFLSGYSTGGNLTNTLGCAASDVIRGIASANGGWRDFHPACKGPSAAVLIGGELDTESPIGPLDPEVPANASKSAQLGGRGLVFGRDDFLQRNGCVGISSYLPGPMWDLLSALPSP